MGELNDKLVRNVPPSKKEKKKGVREISFGEVTGRSHSRVSDEKGFKSVRILNSEQPWHREGGRRTLLTSIFTRFSFETNSQRGIFMAPPVNVLQPKADLNSAVVLQTS